MTAVAVPVAGGLQWYAQELLGWTSTIYPETGPSVVSYFLIWLIGYSLILLFVFTKYKEARALQALLDAERLKFSQRRAFCACIIAEGLAILYLSTYVDFKEML